MNPSSRTDADVEAFKWNPRYLAYCIDKGASSPGEMLDRDHETWPGGVMTGFILWTSARWREWREATGWPDRSPVSEEQQRAFDNWLADRMDGPVSRSTQPATREFS